MPGNFRVIDPSIKDAAIGQVKNKSISVTEVAIKYGVDPRTIYGWLKKRSQWE